MSKHSLRTRSTALAAAISAVLSTSAMAADDNVLDAVTVTATRRSESIQDVPLNISAVSSEQLEVQGIKSLADLGRSVPGLFVVDQGVRSASPIVVRGLNADPIGGAEALGNGGGGTVSTYLGEIPLYVDLKLEDMERVEVLLGPQGTLYGAGTLGGAIRYIPKRPQLGATTLDLRARGYTLAHSESLGADGGFTLNLPIGSNLAFRASVDYLDDPGFIDYNYVVRNPGFSDPEPDFSNPVAVNNNLRRVEDGDYQKTLAGRAALRWQVNDAVDANLTYYYQNQDVGGRSQNHQVSFGTGRYEGAHRYEEPNERRNQLAALEITADLGFAELTSATGFSKYKEFGQRDQTDLLISLEYSYEAFPTFSAFTRENQEDETFNQEVRLVSTQGEKLNWLVGAFFNRAQSYAVSQEFTPGYSQYLVDTLDPPDVSDVVRTDALEYYSADDSDLREQAVYGELSFEFTEKWQVTIGGRWYKYDLETKSAVDFPLAETTFSGGRGPTEVILEFENGGQDDDGTLFKFNTSYKFTDDIMAYLTVSEGYRIGNSNNIAMCDGTAATQNGCASNDREFQFAPDSTINYEIGWRTQFLDKRITFNGAVFYIDWKDPQLISATVVGAIPITVNGSGATTQGIELQLDSRVTDNLTLSASFSHVEAELSEDSPDLIRTIAPPGFAEDFEDGIKGDRLPGSPEQQGSFFAHYRVPMGGNSLTLNYGLTAISDILTRTGGRGGGEALGGFTLHSASAVFDTEAWSLALYAKNLLDKYAETGVRSSTRNVQTVTDENGDPVRVRSYAKDVTRPREIGLRFNYKFDF
jgi:outer membrane receptor protein involved in Fe transport